MNEYAIAAIGECMLELSSLSDGNWGLGFAGDTFNTLWTMRALLDPAVATDYVTAFGDDPFSQRQIGFFGANGIGIADSPLIHGARPGLYAITLDGAERSFTYWRRDAAARQLADDPHVLERSLENKKLVYFSGITLAILEPGARQTLIAALAKARAAGSLVAFDPNYRPRLWQSEEEARHAIGEALAVTDIALPTFPDEQALQGDATMEQTAVRLSNSNVVEFAIKNGEQPALIVDHGGRTEVPAISVQPVDTTGAGDSFNGAYLAARLNGEAPALAAERAHRVAAAVVQVRGALAPAERLRAAFAEERQSLASLLSD